MTDLTGLALLRNDPDVAARILADAVAGDLDAQYAAGLIYAEGRGVEPDLVQAFYWLTLAVQRGDVDAERLRCHVARDLSDDEFARARRLVSVAARALPKGVEADHRRH